MNVPYMIVSSSIAGSYSALSIPGPVNITGSDTGAGGKLAYKVEDLSNYSYQVYVSGSGINGTMYLQQSNNLAGWLSALSQSISGPGDQFFKIRGNNMAFARLLWSGSAGSGSTVTVSVAGTR